MEHSRAGKWSAGLPYINSIQIVLLTAAINAAVVFLFFWGKSLTFEAIVADACICGITTSLIDVFVVHGRMKRLRSRGLLPKEAPQNRLMAVMPYQEIYASTKAALNVLTLVLRYEYWDDALLAMLWGNTAVAPFGDKYFADVAASTRAGNVTDYGIGRESRI